MKLVKTVLLLVLLVTLESQSILVSGCDRFQRIGLAGNGRAEKIKNFGRDSWGCGSRCDGWWENCGCCVCGRECKSNALGFVVGENRMMALVTIIT